VKDPTFTCEWDEGVVGAVALVDPVARCVGFDGGPVEVGDGGAGDGFEFGLAVEVVADIAVVDLRTAYRRRSGLSDEEGDGDGVAASRSEYLPAFAS